MCRYGKEILDFDHSLNETFYGKRQSKDQIALIDLL